MKCPACNGCIQPGKVLLCVACFEILPGGERANLRKHYTRVLQVCKNPAAIAIGMRAKLDRCVRIVQKIKGEAERLAPSLDETKVRVVHAE